MTVDQSKPTTLTPVTDGQTVRITRTLNAPRALVFKAWVEPDRLAQWWGPKGFTNPVCEVDVRPGGAIQIDMRSPDGTVYPMTGEYREIVEPERIVFVSAALDPAGNRLFEVMNTILLAEVDGQTQLTVEAQVISTSNQAAQYLAGMQVGWTQSLERLNDLLVQS